MSRLLLIVASLSLFVGCARSTLPYTPAEQPPGARVSAAYEIIGDRLRIEIDTDGRRLEEAQILMDDQTKVRPQTIEIRPVGSSGCGLAGISVGVGGGNWGGDGVGVGTASSVRRLTVTGSRAPKAPEPGLTPSRGR
jgi:hypothetical protein